MWFEVKDLQPRKKAPYIFAVLKEIEASLRMRIYKDRQIHTETSFQPIKLQESQSYPHTNRIPSNNTLYLRVRCKGQCIRMLFLGQSGIENKGGEL